MALDKRQRFITILIPACYQHWVLIDDVPARVPVIAPAASIHRLNMWDTRCPVFYWYQRRPVDLWPFVGSFWDGNVPVCGMVIIGTDRLCLCLIH